MANPEPRPARVKRGFWRTCRIYFRRVRITVWLIIFATVFSLVYLNQIGLPELAKRPLLQRLRARGLDLRFGRLRLSWFEGIVAEQVRFGPAGQTDLPDLTASEVQVRVNARALWHRHVQVDSLVLHDGKMMVMLAGTNREPRRLALDRIETVLRLLPDDQWALDNFRASFQGVGIRIAGVLTNASALPDLPLFKAEAHKPGPAGRWQTRIRRFADTLDQIRFTGTPELILRLSGDARDLQSFSAHLTLNAPGAETPWGAFVEGRTEIRIRPADSNEVSQAELELTAASARTRWGSASDLRLAATFRQAESFTNDVRGVIRISAQQAETEWARASNFVFSASWVHALTNPIPLSGQGLIECENAQTRWASARELRVAGDLELADAKGVPAPDASWGWWTNIVPYHLKAECGVTGVELPGAAVEAVRCHADWLSPALDVTNLEATVSGRKLNATAALNVATRAASANLDSGVDPQKLVPVLGEAAGKWLGQFTWTAPPEAQGRVEVVLPVWTNRAPDWRTQVLPTLALSGKFNVAHGGSYRGIQADSAQSHFSYSNMCWHLPDLVVTREGGRLEAEHRENDRTKDFYWRIKSTIHPKVVRPLLDAKEQRAFDLLQVASAPDLEAEIWGRSHEPARTGARGRVALTNFSFRGESATTLRTAVLYTNKLLTFIAPQAERGTQHLRADGLLADFNAELVYLTNGFSTAEPMFVARAIGAHVAKAIGPYQFKGPVTARAHGTIPMHGEEGADLHFDVEGNDFHWWKFNLPWIAGHVHWAGLKLNLSEVRCQFYGGAASGAAGFRFPKGSDTEIEFTGVVTNALLQALMADLSERTNHLEGRLDGTLVVNRALSSSTSTVQGYGDMHLRNGLIWDIPLFGVFSPVLDGISPGLGTSRASAANATFVITNGVVRTDDLEIRSPALRLQYRGTVDLESRVNARVEAELLRDVWLVGPLVSTVLWPVTKMFEYRVTGTTHLPKTDPVYIFPKMVTLPFAPFRWLKNLVPGESSSTNAPASK